MSRKWISHILLILSTLLIIIIAVMVRGKQAANGILWKSDTLICNLSSNGCTLDLLDRGITLGVYDPQETFRSSSQIGIDHYFIDWNESDFSKLSNDLKITNSRNRWAMVTVEPWVDKILSRELLTDITKSRYNTQIDNLCTLFKSNDKPLFIRWGHEMDNVTGRYPWAVDNGVEYINAYRYFVTRCRLNFVQGYYVWSPAGNKNLNDYWPGKEYADYLGISVYGFDQYDLDNYGHKRTFKEIVCEKYQRVDHYDRPIMITELGVNGDSGYQKNWLQVGLDNLLQFPKIKTVVYFNSKDNNGAWDKKYSIPQWTIERKLLR